MPNVCRRCGESFAGKGIFCPPCTNPFGQKAKVSSPPARQDAPPLQVAPPKVIDVQIAPPSPKPARTVPDTNKPKPHPKAVILAEQPTQPYELYPLEANVPADAKVFPFSSCDSCKLKRGGQRLPIIGKSFSCLTCPAGPNTCLCEHCFWDYLHTDLVQHPRKIEDLTPNHKHQFKLEDGSVPWARMRNWKATKQIPIQLNPPNIPDLWILRPHFFGKDKSENFASHGFSAQWRGKAYFITALHTLSNFGMAHNPPIDPSRDNPNYHYMQFIEALEPKVDLYHLFEKDWILSSVVGTAGKMVRGESSVYIQLAIPEARSGEEEPNSQNDFAAFEIPSPGKLHLAPIAAQLPMVGAPVWMVSRADPFVPQRLWPGYVVEVNDNVIMWKLEADGEWNHPSGSPVINHLGEVVGVLASLGHLFDGTVICHGPSSGAIDRHFRSAENI